MTDSENTTEDLQITKHESIQNIFTYKIPESIPRNSLEFRIAQKEQHARILEDVLSTENSALDCLPTAQQHALEAELPAEEAELMRRFLEKLSDYERALTDVLEHYKKEYRKDYGDEKLDLETNPKFSEFVARSLYKRLYGKDPVGKIRVKSTLLRFHFYTDEKSNFPNKNPYAIGGLLRTQNAGDVELRNVKVSYELVAEIPDKLEELGATWADIEEGEHAIMEIFDEVSPSDSQQVPGEAAKIREKYQAIAAQSVEYIIADTGEAVGLDKDAREIADNISEVYAQAKEEVLVHWVAGYYASDPSSPELQDYINHALHHEYNFFSDRISDTNRYFAEVSQLLQEETVRASETFFELVQTYNGDVPLISKMLFNEPITGWPQIRDQVRSKVEKYGLPDFIEQGSSTV